MRISAQAQADLVQISDWIAEDDPDAAVRFVEALTAKAIEIGEMPLAFPLLTRRYGVDVRKRSYRRYLIFYTVTRSGVTVARVVHGMRDLTSLFGIS